MNISPQGLQERLNSRGANEFLHRLLLRSLEYAVEGGAKPSALLRRFNGIYLQDSSKVELPAAFGRMWQGNAAHQATLKVQTVLDYQTGRVNFRLAQGRQHDCPLQTTELPAGSLRLADVGYFKVGVFETLNARGVAWLSRLPARVGIWTGEKVTHILEWLNAQTGDCLDHWVELSAQRFAARFIAVRVPPHVAEERRKRVREAARKRTHTHLKPETLRLCDWTLMVTNLDAQALSADEAVRLLRLRWQIELLFKLWKQQLALDTWRTQLPYGILSEVYAKLLLALVQHWLLVLGCWDVDSASLVKATVFLRKQAFHLLAVLHDLAALVRTLSAMLPQLARCKIQKRKARPATFQLLGLALSLS